MFSSCDELRQPRSQLLSASSDIMTILTIVLPFLGVLIAARLKWSHGAGAAEIASCLIMYLLTFVGIEVGFHRHFAHRSFQAVRPVRIILAALGSMALQGSVLWWAGVHRVHHAKADHFGDPHSPLEGLIHAHVGWLFRNLDPPGWRRRGDCSAHPTDTRIPRSRVWGQYGCSRNEPTRG